MTRTHDENQNGLEAFDLLSSYLDEDEWYPRRIEGKYAYSMSYSGKTGICAVMQLSG